MATSSDALLDAGPRTELDHDHAGHDQRDAGEFACVQRLAEGREADQRDQRDADSGPDRVRDADRNRPQRARQRQEAYEVSEADDGERQQTRESMAARQC
jgi:hypothetical protein